MVSLGPAGRLGTYLDAVVVQLEAEVDALLQLRLWLVGRIDIHGLVRDHRRAVVLDAGVDHTVADRFGNHVLGVLLGLEVQLSLIHI